MKLEQNGGGSKPDFPLLDTHHSSRDFPIHRLKISNQTKRETWSPSSLELWQITITGTYNADKTDREEKEIQ